MASKPKLNLKSKLVKAEKPAAPKSNISRASRAANVIDLSARAQLYGAGGIFAPSIADVILGQRTQLSTLGGVWFSPGQPLRPIAQDAKRQWDYPFGYNYRTGKPKSWGDEGIGFDQLRALADACDILRLVIETRKDQIAAIDWDIMPRDAEKNKDPETGQIKITEDQKGQSDEVRKFFTCPSLEPTMSMWDNWLRAMLEDLFVIDCVVIDPRKNMLGDQVLSLDLIDGGTMKRLIDHTGRTPLPPDPAYQQILHGLPAVDFTAGELQALATKAREPGGEQKLEEMGLYTTDRLLYWMRNPRTNKVYGFSPVEQVIITVNTALRKALGDLNYYTEGNIPDAFSGVPETWTIGQIREFQAYWDEIFEGDLAQRRKMKFLPMDASKMKETRPPQLKDEYWDWLARIICFCFSISPQPFLAQMNRATAQTADQTARDEGLLPLLKWVKGRLDWIIAFTLKKPDLEFKWKLKEQVDPKAQAEIDNIYISANVTTADEVRARLGMSPLTDKQKAQYLQSKAPTELDNEGKPIPKQPPSEAKGTPSEKVPAEEKGVKVDLGGVHVHPPSVQFKHISDFREQVPERVVKKKIRAARDPKTGELIGEIEETLLKEGA